LKSQKEKMQNELEAMFQISIESSTQIVKKGWEPWLHLRTQEQKEEYYTNRYKNYLMQNTNMPPSVINEIFTSTNNVLDYLANPLSNAGFKKKGLVVGHVQSGKTANYIALINKAADVGYKLIILIAGVHNNLRTQTQKRVNE
jgi:polynucleotide 5'-kinase involved in rRNA processing